MIKKITEVITAIVIVLVGVVNLTACKRETVVQKEKESWTEIETTVSKEITTVAEKIPAKLETETTETTETTEATAILHIEGERLPAELRPLYYEVYEKVINFEPFQLSIGELSLEEANAIFDAVRNDNPLAWLYFNTVEQEIIFDAEGEQAGCNKVASSYSENWENDEVKFNSFDVVTLEQQCSQAANEIISQIPDGASDEAKYRFIAESICEKTVFEDNSSNGHYLYMTGPLLSGIGICQSYSMAYQYVCQQAGLWCGLQHSKEICHCWNVIMVDGEIYHCDITWYDDDHDEKWLKFGQAEANESHCPNEGQIIAVD